MTSINLVTSSSSSSKFKMSAYSKTRSFHEIVLDMMKKRRKPTTKITRVSACTIQRRIWRNLPSNSNISPSTHWFVSVLAVKWTSKNVSEKDPATFHFRLSWCFPTINSSASWWRHASDYFQKNNCTSMDIPSWAPVFRQVILSRVFLSFPNNDYWSQELEENPN